MADGDLTLAYLLGQMRLEVARLVILSACETGIGFDPNRQGEEYLGLPAGFIVAGAMSVIGSLWSVPDLATALLMVRLIETFARARGSPRRSVRRNIGCPAVAVPTSWNS